MGRAPSGICYELKKNKTKGEYDPRKAHLKAYVRRHDASFRGRKIVRNQLVRRFVEKALEHGQSPDAIAGRLRKQERNLKDVSGDTIARFLKSPYGKLITLPWKKQKYHYRRERKGRLKERVFIEKRPKMATNRLRVGDMEADFIVSGKSGKGVLLVAVCRRLRIAFLEKILPVTVDNVHQAFLKIQERFPEMRTLTLDNDILFQMHRVLEQLLGVNIYFCHPYHSWEKGSVENANRYICKFIPKRTNMARVNEEEIRSIEMYLNDRWLKCLDYVSPKERLEAYRKRRKTAPRGRGVKSAFNSN